MPRTRHIFFVLLLMLSLTGCIHQFPEEEAIRVLTVHLDFDQEMPVYQEIYVNADGTLTRTRAEVGDMERRYVLQAFYRSKNSDVREASRTWTFYRPVSEEPDTTVTIEFPQGTYRIIAWSDYSLDRADYYYSTSDFSSVEILNKDPYFGSTETRDAFRGDIDVEESDAEVHIEMIRPLAKFAFITTDLQKFVQEAWKKLQLEGATDPDASPSGPASLDDIDLSRYGVKFVYPKYMAFAFNMFTNRPADSWLGTHFESTIIPMDSYSAVIGFDYVFVNTHDTSVSVAVEVYDKKDGEVVARISSLDVPLRRAHLTIVRGPFLTTLAGGYMGIDPSFDDDFNIEIK